MNNLMRNLTTEEFKLYKNILKLTQNGILELMGSYLDKYYGAKNVYKHKSFIVALGDIPICLCAHADTVFPSPPKNIFYDREENVIWSPEGCGHDDRAGVFGIVQIIGKGYRPHIIISTDEEIGCIGAMELARYKCPFKDLKYIIQLDRAGANDCVFYQNDNKEFEKYIESFGFKTAIGSFTDIVEYCPSWNISGVNLSIGYVNEHTYIEHLFVDCYLNTIDKVIKMLENPPSKRYKFKQKKFTNVAFNNKLKPGATCTCDGCKQKMDENDLYPIKSYISNHKRFCIDCMMDSVAWCPLCNEAFEIRDKNQELCDDCLKLKGE